MMSNVTQELGNTEEDYLRNLESLRKITTQVYTQALAFCVRPPVPNWLIKADNNNNNNNNK